MALGQGRPEGGVAAGTEAAGIAEVLKSERAGRLLPFKEEQIISSAESLEEEGMTADDVQSHLGDSGLFEAYAIHFAASMGKEQLPPVKRVVANQWWMDARPAPREGWKGVWGAVRGLLGSRAQTPASWGAVSPRGFLGIRAHFRGSGESRALSFTRGSRERSCELVWGVVRLRGRLGSRAACHRKRCPAGETMACYGRGQSFERSDPPGAARALKLAAGAR